MINLPLRECDPSDVLALTQALINIDSVSQDETLICDEISQWVSAHRPDALVNRERNNLIVRIGDTSKDPILFAGHIDTVPPAEYEGSLNNKATLKEGILYGLGSSDMKSGVALMLALLATISVPSTFIFYETEEIEDRHNGLRFLLENHPDYLDCAHAILLEPTDGQIEMGCQGTLTIRAHFHGVRAHSARPWMGENAIQKAVETLQNATSESVSQPKVEINSLTYTPALQVTKIQGGTSANVIPDECIVTINHRFAPSTSAEVATEYVSGLCEGADEIEVSNASAGAMPAMEHPLVSFAQGHGRELVPKVGWTDVARFASIGISAVNCGPGDPTLAHRADEHLVVEKLYDTYELLLGFIDSL